MVTKDEYVHRVMDALGRQTRRDILGLLKDGALPVGDIADRLPISRPAVSKHLRILEQAGLVVYTTRGTRNIFQLSSHGFDVARTYVEGFWDEALASFQRLAEDEADSER